MFDGNDNAKREECEFWKAVKDDRPTSAYFWCGCNVVLCNDRASVKSGGESGVSISIPMLWMMSFG